MKTKLLLSDLLDFAIQIYLTILSFFDRVGIESQVNYSTVYMDGEEFWKGEVTYKDEVVHIGYYEDQDTAYSACVKHSDLFIERQLKKQTT